MRQVILLPRNPKSSEMSLSNQVKQSIDDAIVNLREALAFAARTEHPITITTVADILARLESLESIEEIIQKFGKQDDIPNRFGQV